MIFANFLFTTILIVFASSKYSNCLIKIGVPSFDGNNILGKQESSLNLVCNPPATITTFIFYLFYKLLILI